MSISSISRVACRLLLLLCLALAVQPIKPSCADTTPEVRSVRFGIYAGRTRIVIDVDREVAFSAEAAGDSTQLAVDLPEVNWRVEDDSPLPLHGLASGYDYGSDGPGRAWVIVDMRGPVRIARRLTLEPSEHSPFWRLVTDVEEIPSTEPVSSPAKPQVERSLLPETLAPIPRAKPAAAAAPSPVPRHTVVIDPGHGGTDPGAIAVDGVREKTITLAMARKVRELLEATGRFRVILTREGDEFRKLRERVALAREARAEIFVSLHADSLPLPKQRGASVHILSEAASDAEAALLASREDKGNIIRGADLSTYDATVAGILIDLTQQNTSNKSIAFADMLAEELGRVTPLVHGTRRFANFAVLKSPDTPSVLIELGFLSNLQDAQNLQSRAHRAKLARAIVNAINRHFAAP